MGYPLFEETWLIPPPPPPPARSCSSRRADLARHSGAASDPAGKAGVAVFANGGAISAEYRALSRRWTPGGLISTVPLVMVLWLMVTKPCMTDWLEAPQQPRCAAGGPQGGRAGAGAAGPFSGRSSPIWAHERHQRIESPEGDGTRAWGPPWVERVDAQGKVHREARPYYHA